MELIIDSEIGQNGETSDEFFYLFENIIEDEGESIMRNGGCRGLSRNSMAE